MLNSVGNQKRMGFASTVSFQKALAAYGEGRLNPPLDANKLRELDIPEGSRTTLFHTLQDLKLVDSDGYPTETFKRLVSAYQFDRDEYKKILHQLLLEVYSEVFRRIPSKELAQATPKQYYEAFENFVPKQQRKMIALFRGLCREVGLLDDEGKILHSSDGKFTSKPSRIEAQSSEAHGIATLLPDSQEYLPAEFPEVVKINGSANMNTELNSSPSSLIERHRDYLKSLLDQLPSDGEDSEQQREWWINLLRTNVTLLLEHFERKDQ